MKKWIVVMLLTSMMLSATACGNKPDDKESIETGSVETESESAEESGQKPSQESENIKKISGIGKMLQSAQESGRFYILCVPYPGVDSSEYEHRYENEYYGDGTYVENCYFAYADIRLGRFKKAEDERKALETIADYMGISADDIQFEKTTSCGYPALTLEYTYGTGEEIRQSFDMLPGYTTIIRNIIWM